jgi:transposase
VFSYISPEQRVRKDHPLRPIRTMVDEILKRLSPQFSKMYAKAGRPSIPPEQLLRAQLLQMLYSVRSERLLMGEMDYNTLFRWFVGLNLDDAVWDATVFTKNRDRLPEAEVAKEFLGRVVAQARKKEWTSDEHFSVDGTLLEAWASVKSFQPKDKKSSSVAQNLARRGGSAVDGRTTQHQGYHISQKKRKRIEECFGRLKMIALFRKVRHRGTLKVDWMFSFACAAYNLVRMRNLMAAAVLAR